MNRNVLRVSSECTDTCIKAGAHGLLIKENKSLIYIVTGLRWLDLTPVRSAGYLLAFYLLIFLSVVICEMQYYGSRLRDETPPSLACTPPPLTKAENVRHLLYV